MKEYLTQVRTKAPIIHNITNYVTVNDVANMILAVGASPIMADEKDEVEQITSLTQGLNINIGTLNKRSIESMLLAGHKANQLGHKVVLDPVGAGASDLRTQTACRLLDELKIDVVRGNMSEIKTLAYKQGKTQGVDVNIEDQVTEENLDEAVAFVKAFAKEKEVIVAVTGAIDLVSDGTVCYVIRNGRKEMGRITGTGCQLSGLLCAFISASQDHVLEAAATSVIAMGLAGEIAYQYMKEYDGNATYRNRIIDAIYHMSEEDIESGAKYEIR